MTVFLDPDDMPRWVRRLGPTDRAAFLARLEILSRFGQALYQAGLLVRAGGAAAIGSIAGVFSAFLLIATDQELAQMIQGADQGTRALLVAALAGGVLLAAWGDRQTSAWFKATPARARIGRRLEIAFGILALLVIAGGVLSALIG